MGQSQLAIAAASALGPRALVADILIAPQGLRERICRVCFLMPRPALCMPVYDAYRPSVRLISLPCCLGLRFGFSSSRLSGPGDACFAPPCPREADLVHSAGGKETRN